MLESWIMESSLDLSIIIVSFNTRGDLERCLESLHSPAPSSSHEIVVVDNNSADGSANAARRWKDVRVIETGANLGFARANNIGFHATTGRAVLLLNSDTIVAGGAIDELLATLHHRIDAAVVGPRLVDAQGRPELSFGRMIGPLNELRQKLLVRGHARGWRLASRAVDRATRREHTPDWVSGACLLVRRSDAEAVGFFDERYFMYTEDVDLCAAIRARGRRILFTPSVEIVHLGGRSVRSAPAATNEAYRRSQITFYEKHHPKWAPALRIYLRLRGRLS